MTINYIDKLVDIFNKAESTLIKCDVLPKTVEEARKRGIEDHRDIVKRFKTNSDDDFFFHMSRLYFTLVSKQSQLITK